MYNIDFLKQIEESRRYIFGNRGPSESPPYFPSKDIEIIQCKEDTNGEWVPNPVSESKLEEESQ